MLNTHGVQGRGMKKGLFLDVVSLCALGATRGITSQLDIQVGGQKSTLREKLKGTSASWLGHRLHSNPGGSEEKKSSMQGAFLKKRRRCGKKEMVDKSGKVLLIFLSLQF